MKKQIIIKLLLLNQIFNLLYDLITNFVYMCKKIFSVYYIYDTQ